MERINGKINFHPGHLGGGVGKREGGEREKVGVRGDEAKNHVQMNLSTWRERERGGEREEL